MSATATKNDEVSHVASKAESIKSDATQRFPEAASIGDGVRQGDIYITLIGEIPGGASVVKKRQSQLAPGDTQGSRHCLSNVRNVRMYSLPNATPYDGPVLEVRKEVTVTHPEHGDWILPRGVYAISYQRTQDSEGRIRRVQD